jgi:hypothetical protein
LRGFFIVVLVCQRVFFSLSTWSEMSILTGEIFGSSGDIKSPGSPSFAGIKLIVVPLRCCRVGRINLFLWEIDRDPKSIFESLIPPPRLTIRDCPISFQV